MVQGKEYHINNSSISIIFGDILQTKAEVIVSSDDTNINMRGGVSGAICRKEGTGAIFQDVIKRVPELEANGGGGDLAPLGLLFGNAVIVPLVEKTLTVNDNFLFSVGKVSVGGEEKTFTIGAFGHIFSASKEQMKQALKDNKYLNGYLDLLNL